MFFFFKTCNFSFCTLFLANSANFCAGISKTTLHCWTLHAFFADEKNLRIFHAHLSSNPIILAKMFFWLVPSLPCIDRVLADIANCLARQFFANDGNFVDCCFLVRVMEVVIVKVVRIVRWSSGWGVRTFR